MDDEQQRQLLKNSITEYPDFPKRGVLFRDLFSVLRDAAAFPILINLLMKAIEASVPDVGVIVALESRGFLLGPVLALHFKVPFVPIRKAGKLPGTTKKVTYELEYGSDCFEIHADSMAKNSKVVIVDDLLATGGSMAASCELIKSMDCTVSLCLVVIELTDLDGRAKLTVPVKSLVEY